MPDRKNGTEHDVAPDAAKGVREIEFHQKIVLNNRSGSKCDERHDGWAASHPPGRNSDIPQQQSLTQPWTFTHDSTTKRTWANLATEALLEHFATRQ